ncbi:MAG: hypothetical protein WD042_05550 [Phycisphaeraceae bacterium]
MLPHKLSILLGLVLIGGCATVRPVGKGDVSVLPLQVAHVEPKSGSLIALWMPMRGPDGKSTRLEPVLVTSRYATFIYWASPEYEPDAAEKRLFIFYDNVLKKCWQTRDYAAYLDVIAHQPQDVDVLQIETCTVPRCYMPAEDWKRLEAAMAVRNIRWAIDPATAGPMRFCYCEATGDFVYPGDRQ